MCSGITWHFESTDSSADGQQLKCQESDLVAVLLNSQAHPILKRDSVSCFNGTTCLLSFPTFQWVSIRDIFPFQVFCLVKSEQPEMLGEHLL